MDRRKNSHFNIIALDMQALVGCKNSCMSAKDPLDHKLMNEPILPTRFPSTKSVKYKPDCHCAACLMAKQHRRGTNSKKVIANPDKVMAIRKNVQAPAEMISMDQWVSRTPGRRINTRG